MKISYAGWLGDTGLKQRVVANSLSLSCNDEGVSWYLFALDNGIVHETRVFKDGGADQVDFETNYRAEANNPAPPGVVVTAQPVVTIASSPTFTSKTFELGGVTKKLFARNVGFQQALTVGANTISYTATFPWVKITGIEAVNCEVLDTADFKVYDTAAGTYSGYPNAMLNQFGFTVNMAKDYYSRIARFDADLYVGMVLTFVYTSVSAKTIGINLIMDEVRS